MPTLLGGLLVNCSGQIEACEAASSSLFRELAQDCPGLQQLTAVWPGEVVLQEKARNTSWSVMGNFQSLVTI